MELGRTLITKWGFDMIDSLVWVKVTPQRRLLRQKKTGDFLTYSLLSPFNSLSLTLSFFSYQSVYASVLGYYLNHTKEHCLIGKKGNPIINCHIYCDVLVSELRKTSQKPDEMYSMIENICGWIVFINFWDVFWCYPKRRPEIGDIWAGK